MGLHFTSITLNTPHLQDMLCFYRLVGFHFEGVRVDKGGEVHRAQANGIEFSLYSVVNTQHSQTPVLQLGFKVRQIDKVVAELSKIPGTTCIMDPSDMPDGKKAILLDPDGNSVELCQI